jgi:pyruvate/2-oxoglutarate/acetoin dehydrogenase E1 component
MVIRIQGFDRGKFGGNFHTHNSLPHIPPGVDVVCYSNGEDYVRGFRNAFQQAKAGRVVVFVDCTNLLNLRHLHGRDRGWERSYPRSGSQYSVMGFHDVRRYGTTGKVAVVSYGNGVVTALQARRSLFDKGVIASETEVDIIDIALISEIPLGLKEALHAYSRVVFADICKEGAGGSILASMITELDSFGLLPPCWTLVSAPRTYNPLGTTETFLNSDDVEGAVVRYLDD